MPQNSDTVTKSPVAGRDMVSSIDRAETPGAKLLLSRQVLNARLQPSKSLAIVIDVFVELLAAPKEVVIAVHEEVHLGIICRHPSARSRVHQE